MAGTATSAPRLCRRPSACQGRPVLRSLSQLGFQLLEALDRAATANPRMNGVTPSAQAIVCRLEIEAAVEIQCWAILVELRADPLPVGEDEIDLRRAGKQSTANVCRWNAFGTLMLDPGDFREEGVGLDRHAHDHFVLHDQPRDRLADHAGLNAEH